MDEAKLDRIFQDTEVRADAGTTLDDDTIVRLGRALATLARRRGMERTIFVIGRDDHSQTGRARDALLRGLLLGGHRVIDVGIVDAERHEFALNEIVAPAGVRIAVNDEGRRAEISLEVFLGGGPLVGAGLRALRDVFAQGDFCSGVGELKIVDIEPAFRGAARHGMGVLSRDTIA